MKIGVLTSSRADYGIYFPLLSKFKNDDFFDLEIIAFGTHMSRNHGMTISEVVKGDYKKVHTISSLLSNDNALDVASSYGLTVLKFANFWNENKYDIVFCLGDRFEMSAAVQAGIPHNVQFAHIHGGEITLGAIDNVYRHQLSLASILHFTATETAAQKVGSLCEGAEVHNVGALSLDEVNQLNFKKREDFLLKFEMPDMDFALVTLHPETLINSERHNQMAVEMQVAIAELAKNLHIVITMPNADTLGSVFRDAIWELKKNMGMQLTVIENFGKQHYFNAMKHAAIMIGNTSSGIIEAASFGKYVIDVGDRQKGRATGSNVIHCAFKAKEIISCTRNVLKNRHYMGSNIYYKSGAAIKIVNILKEYYARL